ncbi:ORF6N domain-containing protein [Lactobacillus iners]|nr:ORF6N domain-containing protein [Lactobacillus iners]
MKSDLSFERYCPERIIKIYGYETKNFNRQVKNNIEKFEGEDFMFN